MTWLRRLRAWLTPRGHVVKIDDHAQRAAIWREEERERAMTHQRHGRGRG